VIKSIVLPTSGQVALFTSFVRVPFFRNLPLVYVFVAINTALPDIPEFPFFLLLMTGKTRGCHMCAIQWKRRFSVLFQGKRATGETIHRVTSRAVGLTR
jgi:hypothetical protein